MSSKASVARAPLLHFGALFSPPYNHVTLFLKLYLHFRCLFKNSLFRSTTVIYLYCDISVTSIKTSRNFGQSWSLTLPHSSRAKFPWPVVTVLTGVPECISFLLIHYTFKTKSVQELQNSSIPRMWWICMSHASFCFVFWQVEQIMLQWNMRTLRIRNPRKHCFNWVWTLQCSSEWGDLSLLSHGGVP